MHNCDHCGRRNDPPDVVILGVQIRFEACGHDDLPTEIELCDECGDLLHRIFAGGEGDAAEIRADTDGQDRD